MDKNVRRSMPESFPRKREWIGAVAAGPKSYKCHAGNRRSIPQMIADVRTSAGSSSSATGTRRPRGGQTSGADALLWFGRGSLVLARVGRVRGSGSGHRSKGMRLLDRSPTEPCGSFRPSSRSIPTAPVPKAGPADTPQRTPVAMSKTMSRTGTLRRSSPARGSPQNRAVEGRRMDHPIRTSYATARQSDPAVHARLSPDLRAFSEPLSVHCEPVDRLHEAAAGFRAGRRSPLPGLARRASVTISSRRP